VPSISSSEKTSPSILWQRLTALKVFDGFSDKERDAFLQAYERDPALCMRRFAPGDLVCRKGEYELDLCFVLSGSVDLLDDVPDAGRVRIRRPPLSSIQSTYRTVPPTTFCVIRGPMGDMRLLTRLRNG
jgi:hypothetical protein